MTPVRTKGHRTQRGINIGVGDVIVIVSDELDDVGYEQLDNIGNGRCLVTHTTFSTQTMGERTISIVDGIGRTIGL